MIAVRAPDFDKRADGIGHEVHEAHKAHEAKLLGDQQA
jgi:hypothetical protein